MGHADVDSSLHHSADIWLVQGGKSFLQTQHNSSGVIFFLKIFYLFFFLYIILIPVNSIRKIPHMGDTESLDRYGEEHQYQIQKNIYFFLFCDGKKTLVGGAIIFFLFICGKHHFGGGPNCFWGGGSKLT